MIHMPLSRAHSAMARSSGSVYTDPVGLQGEQRISPLVSFECARSRSLTLTLRPHSMSPSTATGSARARCTIWGYETHAGVGMSTRSWGPNSVKHALKSDCLEPELMMMLSALTGLPRDSVESWWAIAVLSSG